MEKQLEEAYRKDERTSHQSDVVLNRLKTQTSPLNPNFVDGIH